MSTSDPKRLMKIADAAPRFGVTEQAVRNWIRKGRITVYKMPGVRAGLVDLDEIQAATRTRPRYGSYGGKAKVVSVKPRPVVVPEANQ